MLLVDLHRCAKWRRRSESNKEARSDGPSDVWDQGTVWVGIGSWFDRPWLVLDSERTESGPSHRVLIVWAMLPLQLPMMRGSALGAARSQFFKTIQPGFQPGY